MVDRPTTRTHITELQNLVDEFVDDYNHRRPHSSLGKVTPAVAYRRLPKDQPHDTAPEPTTGSATTSSTQPEPCHYAEPETCITS